MLLTGPEKLLRALLAVHTVNSPSRVLLALLNLGHEPTSLTTSLLGAIHTDMIRYRTLIYIIERVTLTRLRSRFTVRTQVRGRHVAVAAHRCGA